MSILTSQQSSRLAGDEVLSAHKHNQEKPKISVCEFMGRIQGLSEIVGGKFLTRLGAGLTIPAISGNSRPPRGCEHPGL